MSVAEQLEPAWAHAFLRRTRMLDADFQGDVLAVISKFLQSLSRVLLTFARPNLFCTSNRQSTASGNAMSSPESIHGKTPRFECHPRRVRRRLWPAQGVDHGNARELAVSVRNSLVTLFHLSSFALLRTFCVGVSTAFGIVTRLDRLMVAVKELVGEQYHIDGIELPLHHRRPPGAEM
jgi:hypothetical protein